VLSPHEVGIVVAGMHRSGTSLVASVFAAAKFWVAPQLIRPGRANPKGYFEDLKMHQLHRQMLEHYETDWNTSPRLRRLRRGAPLQIPPELEPQADAIVAEYNEHAPWVWKNPRATLFLEAWAERFPDAVFVLPVREPAAVAHSLVRRGSRMGISGEGRWHRIRRLRRGVSLWYSYNAMALRFIRRQPERAVVIRIPEDLPRLQEITGQNVFEEGLLKRPPSRVRIMGGGVLSALLYRRLVARADVERIGILLQQTQEPPAA
jgi:hypothetical protein